MSSSFLLQLSTSFELLKLFSPGLALIEQMYNERYSSHGHPLFFWLSTLQTTSSNMSLFFLLKTARCCFRMIWLSGFTGLLKIVFYILKLYCITEVQEYFECHIPPAVFLLGTSGKNRLLQLQYHCRLWKWFSLESCRTVHTYFC